MKRGRQLVFISTAVALGIALSYFFYSLGGDWKSEEKGIPERIVCMAPNITEIVFALGQAERVVGVTDFCNYPPEARKKKRVGGYINPNFERLTVLAPDLIILQGRHEKVADFCGEKDISFINMKINNIESIFQGIESLGERLGCSEEASSLIGSIKGGLDEVKRGVKGADSPSVFLCLGRRPGSLSGLYTTGKDGFLSEIIGIAGGMNIFSDALTSYPQASKEALIRREPQVIIETYPGEDMPDARRALLQKDWRSMSTLPAVKSGRIYFLTDDFLLVPGPRVHLAARKIAEILHPERFYAR